MYGIQYPKCHGVRLLYHNNSSFKRRVTPGLLQILTESWASVGIGNKMPHSLMFIIAPNNGNVSLSVRLTEYALLQLV